jgi:hypothetical protein
LHETPAGRLAQARSTALANPPVEVTVQVELPFWPCCTERLDGEQASEKSGLEVGVTVTQFETRL